MVCHLGDCSVKPSQPPKVRRAIGMPVNRSQVLVMPKLSFSGKKAAWGPPAGASLDRGEGAGPGGHPGDAPLHHSLCERGRGVRGSSSRKKKAVSAPPRAGRGCIWCRRLSRCPGSCLFQPGPPGSRAASSEAGAALPFRGLPGRLYSGKPRRLK